MRYNLDFYTYSGMRIPILEGADRETAQDEVRRLNRRARKWGQPVEKVGHNRWEHQEEGDNAMVGDRHGVLVAKKVRGRR
jgi:hypothetical protein